MGDERDQDRADRIQRGAAATIERSVKVRETGADALEQLRLMLATLGDTEIDLAAIIETRRSEHHQRG